MFFCAKAYYQPLMMCFEGQVYFTKIITMSIESITTYPRFGQGQKFDGS